MGIQCLCIYKHIHSQLDRRHSCTTMEGSTGSNKTPSSTTSNANHTESQPSQASASNEPASKSQVSANATLCVVCSLRPRALALVPCGHFSVCVPCGHGVQTCPNSQHMTDHKMKMLNIGLVQTLTACLSKKKNRY
ncbi:unnamed protein product [Adineta ricciae]|uniref:Uncharacterized protein n=1 Tax=Adineta ricciae TaxID=249248 RepID=A0A814CKL3_ADIRI|nr:unnamed protein product [Adineta ricciae]